MSESVEGFYDAKSSQALFQITEDEIKLVNGFEKEANNHLNEYIEYFYNWIPHVPEYKTLFSRPGLEKRVKNLQLTYWREFFECQLDDKYVSSRCIVGTVHARINLPISSYLAGINASSDWWYKKIQELQKEKAFRLITAFNKLLFFDMAVVTAAYSKTINDLIDDQSRSLIELSTPTIELWDEVLILPIVGVLDSKRAEEMTDMMLNKIAITSAKYIIIDIQGVSTVDSTVANHLIKMSKATKLMGCECILSGISPEIAQSLVKLGIDLDAVETKGTLKAAFKMTLTKSGVKMKKVIKDI